MDLGRIIFFSCIALFASLGHAEEFPARPVKMVIGFSPGGGSDVIGRIFSKGMEKSLGQAVIVENRPGAGGVLGADSVAKSKPDGYTLFFGSTGTNTMAPAVYKKMPYNPESDLQPIAQVAKAGGVLVINNKIPARNIAEFIALARKSPGKFTYGSSGNGSTVHFSGILFSSAAGLDMIHVPYKGDAPALTDIVAGQVDMGIFGIAAAYPLIAAGKLRAIAVTSPQRVSIFPDVPTVAEAGLPSAGFATWFGIFAAPGTPPDVVAKISAAAKAASESPELRKQLSTYGVPVEYLGNVDFGAHVQAELVRWKAMAKQFNITTE